MQNIINYLIGISVSIAAAMFAYAGFLYTTGGANPTQINRAHKIFKNVLIGFLIAISAWLIVQTLLSAVFDKDGKFWAGRDWFELKCVADEKRLMDAEFSDLIREVLPDTEAAPVTGVSGDVVICPEGANYDQRNNTCVSANGSTVPLLNSGDLTNRSILQNQDISVNAAYPRTSLEGMRPNTLNKVVDIKTSCGANCSVIVTGGTETTGGHTCDRSPQNHCTGYKVDLRPTPGVNSYIYSLCGNKDSCTAGGATYTREFKGGANDHWDIFVP